MIELDQMKATLSAYKQPLKEVGDSLELEAKGRLRSFRGFSSHPVSGTMLRRRRRCPAS